MCMSKFARVAKQDTRRRRSHKFLILQMLFMTSVELVREVTLRFKPLMMSLQNQWNKQFVMQMLKISP